MTQAVTERSANRETASGTLVAVVGPSGVGKDSLMNFARQHFAGRSDLHFVRRVITRPRDAVGEDHEPVTLDRFEALSQAGAFAVSWRAHGLGYGIPADVYQSLGHGDVVIANGSRSALEAFRSAFANLVVVNVTARPEVLAKRLAARGRETAADIEARLARATEPLSPDLHVVEIDNSGELEAAGRTLVDLIESLLHKD